MLMRLARLIACALLVCLTAQPLPFLAMGATASTALCCKDKQVCCCRRSHNASGGPALVADLGCGTQCRIPVRNIKPLAAIQPLTVMPAAAAPATRPAVQSVSGFARAHRDVFLYQRPPPAEA
ncbi:MAG: hypothetical protein LAP38_20370 [Acidobacteriia bacterium]|nr:hypothetical protein [Terriglobia bacterium]